MTKVVFPWYQYLPRTLLALDVATTLPLSTLSSADVAKLVYRDHVKVKHADKTRLANEVKEKLKVFGQESGMDQDAIDDDDDDEDDVCDAPGSDFLTKLLVKYLMEASKPILSPGCDSWFNRLHSWKHLS